MNARLAPSSPTLLAAGGVVGLVLLAAVVLPGAGLSPFVVRTAELGLAGGAAYLLDDAAAQLTTVTPIGVWRRRLPGLAAGAAVLAGAWVAILIVLDWRAARPPVVVTAAELAVLFLASMAAAAFLFRRGDPCPGARVAPVVVLSGVSAIVAEPVLGLTIFTPWDGSGAATTWVGWGAGGLVAAVVLAVASRDPAGHSRGPRPGSPREVGPRLPQARRCPAR